MKSIYAIVNYRIGISKIGKKRKAEFPAILKKKKERKEKKRTLKQKHKSFDISE